MTSKFDDAQRPSCGYAGAWAEKLENAVVDAGLNDQYAINLARQAFGVYGSPETEAIIYNGLFTGPVHDSLIHKRQNAQYRLNATAITLDTLPQPQKSDVFRKFNINKDELKQFKTAVPKKPSVVQWIKDSIDSRSKISAKKEAGEFRLQGMVLLKENANYHSSWFRRRNLIDDYQNEVLLPRHKVFGYSTL